MGAKLVQFYHLVEVEKGLAGKIALATETKLPSTKAALEADSPELLRQFGAAFTKVTGKPAPRV